jgi:hypothetical protein
LLHGCKLFLHGKVQTVDDLTTKSLSMKDQ